MPIKFMYNKLKTSLAVIYFYCLPQEFHNSIINISIKINKFYFFNGILLHFCSLGQLVINENSP